MKRGKLWCCACGEMWRSKGYSQVIIGKKEFKNESKVLPAFSSSASTIRETVRHFLVIFHGWRYHYTNLPPRSSFLYILKLVSEERKSAGKLRDWWGGKTGALKGVKHSRTRESRRKCIKNFVKMKRGKWKKVKNDKNKVIHTAALVACWWAGKVIEMIIRAFGQE